MTATIRSPEPQGARHRKHRRRRTRFSSMESRGVIESPAPDTTELLIRRDVRWGLLTIIMLLTGALVAGAIWLLQRPAAQAESAVAAMESAAQSLGPELDSLAEIAGGLAGRDIDSASVAAHTRAVDARARELFNAAGALPTTDSDLRSMAADVATSALDATRLISDATAYRATVIQILVPPALETDPELVALDDAVRAFGSWQQSFNEIRTALPTGAGSEVSSALAVLAGSLESIQSQYIDALRDDDGVAAEEIVIDLANRLAAIEGALMTSLADVETRAGNLIDGSLLGIEDLLR
jgi:hypothetical protein